MDYVELGSFVAMVYSSAVLFFLAKKFSAESKASAYLSVILAVTLLVHGVNHLGEFLGNDPVADAGELFSAILVVGFGVAYSYFK